jgi:hypothetical protein
MKDAVRLNNNDMINFLILQGFPLDNVSLLDSTRNNNIELTKFLYDKGCRYNKYDNIFFYKPTLEMVKVAFTYCEYDIYGRFRDVVEYATDDILNWVYEWVTTHQQPKNDESTNNELTIGPSGYNRHTQSDNITQFGWGLFDAAINYGTFERFMWLVDHNFPEYNTDKYFWASLLSPTPVTNLAYSKENWSAKAPERQKIKEWCIQNDFNLTSEALSQAIIYEDTSLKTHLLEHTKPPITTPVISAACLKLPLSECKALFDPSQILKQDVWYICAKIKLTDIDKLYWLRELQSQSQSHNQDKGHCPYPEHLLAKVIHSACKEVLDWLVANDVKPTLYCWVKLSNRYLLEDTEDIVEWLTTHNCPPDPNIIKRIDICRPYAVYIVDHVEALLTNTPSLHVSLNVSQ